jgi:glycosyltransferase involved in cell wall biosynthesis
VLREHGFEVEVLKVYIRGNFFSQWGWAKKNEVVTYQGIKVYDVSLKPLLPGLRTWTLSKLSRFAAEVLERHVKDVEIIHSHAVFQGGWAAKFLSKQFAIPWVHSEHASQLVYGIESLSLADKARAFSVLDSADALFFVSAFQKQKVSEYFSLKPDKAKVIPNMLSPLFANSTLALEKKYTALTIQSWVEVKQPQLLLEAWSLFIQINPGARLLWVGSGPLKAKLISEIKDTSLFKSIDFVDYASRQEVLDYLNQACFYISSSASETFGIAIMESLSQGLPVVAINNGSVEEILIEPHGIITENDANSLFEAILEMSSTWNNYSAAALRADILKRYGSDAILEMWVKEYQNLIP